jgi:microcystin-dependent protein
MFYGSTLNKVVWLDKYCINVKTKGDAGFMGDYCFIGSIMAWGADYAPQGWAFCNGQQLSISQYQALYSLIGVSYGGDGRTYFNLPNLCSRIVVGSGGGAGLTPYSIGQKGGFESVTLAPSQMGEHNHNLNVNTNASMTSVNIPDPTCYIGSPKVTGGSYINKPVLLYNPDNSQGAMAMLNGASIQPSPATPNVNAHENRQPILALNYIICLDGEYPVRPD